MEAKRKVETEDMNAVHIARAQAWAAAQDTWDLDTNEWRVALATAETNLTTAQNTREAIMLLWKLWSSRPQSAIDAADDNTDEYDIVLDAGTAAE
jgi:hypothetical protein